MNDTGMSPQGQTGLAAPEQAELQALEQVVSSGLAKFIEVGNALARIREARLYRASHATFEEYCRERWHLDKRYANRIIQASEVAANLGPIGPVPTNEAQVRPLASLPLLNSAKFGPRPPPPLQAASSRLSTSKPPWIASLPRIRLCCPRMKLSMWSYPRLRLHRASSPQMSWMAAHQKELRSRALRRDMGGHWRPYLTSLARSKTG